MCWSVSAAGLFSVEPIHDTHAYFRFISVRLSLLHCVPPLPIRGLKVLSIRSTCCLSLNFQHSCIHATVRALATQVFIWPACSQSVYVGCSHLAPVRASLRSPYAWPSALPVNPQLCSITYAPRFWASDVHAVPLACMCPASCTISNASMWLLPVCLPASCWFSSTNCVAHECWAGA